MALVSIPKKQVSFSNADEISQFLSGFGIEYQCWELPQSRIKEDASAEEILAAYSAELAELKKSGGYPRADVVSLSPETTGIDELLMKFKKEHTHSEDEVRFCIKGRGIFHINPQLEPGHPEGAVFSIEMVAGDMISVPAGTRHWFNLCQEKSIQVIRLFQDTTGWTPYYSAEGQDALYEPLCFSDIKESARTNLKTVVRP